MSNLDVSLLQGSFYKCFYYFRQLASLESEAVSAGVILPSSLDVDCEAES